MPGAWRTRRSRPSCCRAWRARRASAVCLLDTAVKDGRGLLEWLSPDALTALVAEAHAAGLEMALAGALRAEDLPVVLDTGADIAGVRSAACGGGRRSGPLDPERVRALRAACAYAAAGALMSPAACRRWAHLRALRSRVAAGTASPQASAASVGMLQQVFEHLRRGLGLDQAAQAEADVPALVALDPRDALAHPGQGAVVQVVEQRVLPGVEDDSLEQHVVEADALAEPGATRGELRGHRRQPLLEELEQRGRGVVPGRGAPLVRRISGQLEHLGADAVEEPRVALLVAALEEEDPGHQALLRDQLRPPGRVGERRQVLGDGLLGHAEAGEERGQASAALGREIGPRAGVRREVDRRRTPLQAGDDPGEEVGPEAALGEHEVASHHALPQRLSHRAKVASGRRRSACLPSSRGRATRPAVAARAR